jgi:hypothetical protein
LVRRAAFGRGLAIRGLQAADRRSVFAAVHFPGWRKDISKNNRVAAATQTRRQPMPGVRRNRTVIAPTNRRNYFMELQQ